MKKKLLVLGLVCLLSNGVYAGEQAETSGPVAENSEKASLEIQDHDPKSPCRRCCCKTLDKLGSGCSWVTTHKKIIAGLAGVSAVVYWIYNYGCSCCNSKTVERAQ